MQPRLRLALDVISTLRRSGHVALLVGGCVRDRLLGIEPKDYDIATSASPAQIHELIPGSQLVGAHFGVSLVTRAPGVEVEVATFRSEGTYSDGRRPDQVLFVTNPELDARRRDFSINGLFEDPSSGQILDYVGGQADLRDKIVRAIGDASLRFREDHLRMLRAVRFATRLGFSIEPETMEAICSQASRVKLISTERIRDELVRILTEGGAQRGLELLDSTHLLEEILPEVKAFQGVRQPPEFHPEGDVWTHVLMMLGMMRNPTVTLAFGVLLHDVGKPATFREAERIRFDGHAEVGAQMSQQILHRLKFPNEDVRWICLLVANHMKFKDVQNMRLSTLKRFLNEPYFHELLELHRLDCAASNGYTDAYEFVIEKLNEFGSEELQPANLITGDDLIAAGYPPGPRFKEALSAVETAQLEGEISTKEEAFSVVRLVMER